MLSFDDYIVLMQSLFDSNTLGTNLEIILDEIRYKSTPIDVFFKTLRKLAIFDNAGPLSDVEYDYEEENSYELKTRKSAIKSIDFLINNSALYKCSYNRHINVSICPVVRFFDSRFGQRPRKPPKGTIEEFCDKLPFHCHPVEVVEAMNKLKMISNSEKKHYIRNLRRPVYKYLPWGYKIHYPIGEKIGNYFYQKIPMNALPPGYDYNILNVNWRLFAPYIRTNKIIGCNSFQRSFEDRLSIINFKLNLFTSALSDLIRFNINCPLVSENFIKAFDYQGSYGLLIAKVLYLYPEVVSKFCIDYFVQNILEVSNMLRHPLFDKMRPDFLIFRSQIIYPQIISKIYGDFSRLCFPSTVKVENLAFFDTIIEFLQGLLDNDHQEIILILAKFKTWFRNTEPRIIVNPREIILITIFANLLNYLDLIKFIPKELKSKQIYLISFFKRVLNTLVMNCGTCEDGTRYWIYDDILMDMQDFDAASDSLFFGFIYSFWSFYEFCSMPITENHDEGLITRFNNKYKAIDDDDDEFVFEQPKLPVLIPLQKYKEFISKHI